MNNSLFERIDTNKACVGSEPDGFSGAKVLNAIADDKSWILFIYHCTVFVDSKGRQSGDGGQIVIKNINLTRRHRITNELVV